jgi:hypothetical protein
MSMDELAKITPVKPPTVNKKINPNDHINEGDNFNTTP